jgi:hypothetical protein
LAGPTAGVVDGDGKLDEEDEEDLGRADVGLESEAVTAVEGVISLPAME